MTGMLWLMRDDKKSIADHLSEAVAYCLEKYGKRPLEIRGHLNVNHDGVVPCQNVLVQHLYLVLEA